jgi:FdrA protein
MQEYRIVPGRYVDSVRLMQVSRAVEQRSGVREAAAIVDTEQNLEILTTAGFQGLPSADPSALLFAVDAADGPTAEAALDEAVRLIDQGSSAGEHRWTLDDLPALIGPNDFPVMLVTTPGPYVEEVARRALDAGAHLHIFSSNVPVETEVALKERGRAKGLLVMGPDCGTAILDGVGLGFANRVRGGGDVGVVAASGSGAQELTVQLDRGGLGISQVIGTGSNDLSERVGGLTARQGIALLRPQSEMLVVVAKRPDPRVMASILEELQDLPSAFVALGRSERRQVGRTLVCGILDEAVAHLLSFRGRSPPPVPAPPALPTLDPGRRFLRGYFVGGSLAYQAQAILRSLGLTIHSNAPLDPEHRVSGADDGARHLVIDTGAEEFVSGRPHPMIDPIARNERLVRESCHGEVRVLLFDVVLGYGSAPDPLVGLESLARGPLAIASICGTDRDPQGLDAVRRRLEALGVVPFDSAAQAARFAGRALGGAP